MSDASTPVQLPESLKRYFGSERIRIAVDSLLGPKPTPPADFGWKQMDGYYQAILSAHQVRCEYAQLLAQAFKDIWSCDLLENRFKQLSVIDSLLSVDTIWSERQLSMLFREKGSHPEYTLELSVYAWTDEGMRIYASLVHSSKPESELLKLPKKSWHCEDGELWTPKDENNFGADKPLPIKELRRKAEIAVEATRNFLSQA